MAAASNLAGALICYLAPRPGDFLAIDKKALVRPIPVDSPMTGLDISLDLIIHQLAGAPAAGRKDQGHGGSDS